MKKRLIALFLCFMILVSLASCGQEEQINLANTPIADHTAYQDKILYGDVRVYNHNSVKYEVPDSYEDQYTNCGILKVLTFEGAPDTIMSYMGIDYKLTDSYEKKFSYYTTEDIISFVGIDYKGYIPETREKFSIEYCSDSKEIVSLIDHSAYRTASTHYHTVGEELPIPELAEIAKKILTEDYKKDIDFSKYTMYCNAIVPNETISGLGSYHTKRFYWRRYVHGVCVHEISVDLRHDGVLQKFVCPPAFDESAIEKIPNLTEEQYTDLALNFVKDVYKSSGEKVSIGNIAIDHNTWHNHEEIRNSTYHMMPTMRLVYLDHPQRMYAIKYRFIWSSFYEDGNYNTYAQDFYIPVQAID